MSRSNSRGRPVRLILAPFPQPKHADYFRALLDGATRAGVKRLVLLSPYGVDKAPPENPLRRIELTVETSGVPYTIVWPGAFMQNFSEGLRWRESFAEGIRERDEIATPGGDGVVSYVSTEGIEKPVWLTVGLAAAHVTLALSHQRLAEQARRTEELRAMSCLAALTRPAPTPQLLHEEVRGSQGRS